MMNKAWGKQTAIVLLAASVLPASCHARSDRPTPSATAKLPPTAAVVDLDAEMARALEARRPVVILVVDSGENSAEEKSYFESWAPKGNTDGAIPVVLDLGVSRNRATAARFHITDTNTPMFVCLSPKGVIISRDEPPSLAVKPIAELAERASQLDAKVVSLEEAVAKNKADAAAQLALADFLFAQKNAREAIPHFAIVAHSETADTTFRVRAWVDLARAHLWIGEPEKARHEATNLIAILGPKSPEAVAGGNLVHGLQDANAKRTALARQEFGTAIAAAPKSTYARQAAEAMAKLPKEEK